MSTTSLSMMPGPKRSNRAKGTKRSLSLMGHKRRNKRLRAVAGLVIHGGQGSGDFGHGGRPGQVGGSGAGGSVPDLELIQRLGDKADESLSPEAERAIASFVGHGPKSRGKDSFESPGIWSQDRLEGVFTSDDLKNIAIRRELKEKFAPVKAELEKIYGSRITLYRTEIKSADSKPRVLLSWTADKRFAEHLAGVNRHVKPITDSQIVDAIHHLNTEGQVKFRGYVYKVGNDKDYVDFYKAADDYGPESYITDMDRSHFKDALKERQSDLNELIAKSNEAAKSIITRHINLSDVVWMTDRANQKEFIVKSRPVHNAQRNPARLDPTRTIMLRKAFTREITRRMNDLLQDVFRLLVHEDAFGLKTAKHVTNEAELPLFVYGTFKDKKILNGVVGHSVPRKFAVLHDYHHKQLGDGYSDVAHEAGEQVEGYLVKLGTYDLNKTDKWETRYERRRVYVTRENEQIEAWCYFPKVTENTRWSYQPDEQKVEAFRKWLSKQVTIRLGGDIAREDQWWDGYIKRAYRAGAERSYTDAKGISGLGKPEVFQGAKGQFVSTLSVLPSTRAQVKLLASRTFTDLEGITGKMSNSITRALVDGLIRGRTKEQIASDIHKTVGIDLKRATTISNYNLSKAFAEGQLTAMELMGVDKLGVLVEWHTSGLGKTAKGNPSPCKLCAPLARMVLTVKQARGLLPRHYNCLCSFIPTKAGTIGKGGLGLKNRKVGQSTVQQAIDKSLMAEIPLSGKGKAMKTSKRRLALQKNKSRWAGAQLRLKGKKPTANSTPLVVELLHDRLSRIENQIHPTIEQAAAHTELNPTQGQIEAGNYKKGKVNIHGLIVTIENPKGSTQPMVGSNGNTWSRGMAHHYGYFSRTEGVDGDHVDCFVGPDPDTELAFVIDQQKRDGSFDEHKVMLGFPTEQSAKQGYLDNYPKGWTGLAKITPMTIPDLREWLAKQPHSDAKWSAITGNSFPGHAGRPGERGGSAPKGGGGHVTDTPEFKAWFGDSKVVDSDGKPLVMYHGTTHDVSKFDPEIAAKARTAVYGHGFYFTPDPAYAELITARSDTKASIIPAYISLRKPKMVSADASPPGVFDPAGIREQFEKEGYDGVIIHDAGVITEVVAFKPEQIKSATGNRGTFDLHDPVITNWNPITGNRWSDEARAAALLSRKAHEASTNTPDSHYQRMALGHSARAVEASTGTDYLTTAKAHDAAASNHIEAMKQSTGPALAAHNNAAQWHSKAAHAYYRMARSNNQQYDVINGVDAWNAITGNSTSGRGF